MSAPTMNPERPFEVKMDSRGGQSIWVKDAQTRDIVQLGDQIILKAERNASDPSRPSRKDKPRWWRFW